MDRDEALKLLNEGRIEEWNQRRSSGEEIPSLIAADLRGTELSRADLREAKLSMADLRGAKLSMARLNGANLRGADLSGAKLRGADLSGARFYGADLSGADLSEAELRGADVYLNVLDDFDINGADLRGADLRGADLRGADLSVAELGRADLSEAKLIVADLSEAKLSMADLSEAKLSGADLRGVNLHGFEVGGADLSGAILNGLDISEEDLSEAKLSGAKLRGTKLSGAKLGRADLSGADLSGADLSEADLSGADLSEANLSDTILFRARIIRCQLANAVLENAEVTDCQVHETRGRPIPPGILRVSDGYTLTGEDARNFFNPPATVEVYLTGRLTELELGCYHFHLGDMYYQRVGIGVHFVRFRHEGDGSVLRFQGETFDDVYGVLPHLLAPFRFSEAIDWEKTFAAMPDNRRTEATIKMIQLAAKTPKARYRLAEQMGLHLKSFGTARMEWISTKSGSGEAVQILVACNQKTIKQIEEERRAELEDRRKPLQLTVDHSKVFMFEGDYMPRDIHTRDIVGSIVGDKDTLQARDINYQQLWNQAGSSIGLPALAEELGRLRATMRQEASEPEHDEALGAVASAEKAAKAGDGPKVLEYLKAAGKWALDTATKIGTSVASDALTKAIGVDKP